MDCDTLYATSVNPWEAIRHHLDVPTSARNYSAGLAGVAHDLTFSTEPVERLLVTLDPLLATPIHLTDREFDDLLAFVGDGLLDPKARPHSLCRLIPESVPSGRPLLFFEGC